MKKFWFCAIVLFSVSAHALDTEDNNTVLSGKFIINDAANYFVFSDGTCWQVFGFQIRWRSFSEWWKKIQLLTPEKCDCKPDDWVLGSKIEAYPINDSSEIDISNANNIESLKKCSHYLVNVNNGLILFGQKILPVDCMSKIYKEAYSLAYNQGYQDSFYQNQKINHQRESDAYSQGYQKGYQKGFRDGFKKN